MNLLPGVNSPGNTTAPASEAKMIHAGQSRKPGGFCKVFWF